jgi:hypothetical protein
MAHQPGDLIYAADFNAFVSNVNLLWGSGSGNIGLGQTSITATASTGDLIDHTAWATLSDHINKIYLHQTHDIGDILALPAKGQIISYDQELVDRTALVKTNFGQVAVEGSDISLSLNNSTTWQTKATREARITFPTPDQARYFFNAGGRILMSFPGIDLVGNQKSIDWNNMFDQGLGTLTLSTFGFYRSGAGYTVNSYLTDFSYYSLTDTYQPVLSINNNTGHSDYNNNRIVISLKSNGVNLAGNGDHGSTVYILMEAFDLSTDGDDVLGALTCQVAARPADTTYISSTWGSVNVYSVTNTQI